MISKPCNLKWTCYNILIISFYPPIFCCDYLIISTSVWRSTFLFLEHYPCVGITSFLCIFLHVFLAEHEGICSELMFFILWAPRSISDVFEADDCRFFWTVFARAIGKIISLIFLLNQELNHSRFLLYFFMSTKLWKACVSFRKDGLDILCHVIHHSSWIVI